jgi:hypothetical protein
MKYWWNFEKQEESRPITFDSDYFQTTSIRRLVSCGSVLLSSLHLTLERSKRNQNKPCPNCANVIYTIQVDSHILSQSRHCHREGLYPNNGHLTWEMFIFKPFQLLWSPDKPKLMSGCNYVNMPHSGLCSVFGHYLRPAFRQTIRAKSYARK